MKSLLIKGIEMPEDCYECPCLRQDNYDGATAYQCNITLEVTWNGSKIRNCPLEEIDIPEEHGDLVDKDALIGSLSINPENCPGCPEPEWLQSMADTLDTAEVVLKARKPVHYV